MKILNYGSLNIDHVYVLNHFVRSGETMTCEDYNQFPGGKGLNQSIALSSAGLDVYHAGKIGLDGLQLTQFLSKENVSVTHTIADEKHVTGHAIIQVDKHGENRIILHGGANQEITKDEIDNTLSAFCKGDILLIQNEINNIKYIMQEAHKKGMKIIFNPAPYNNMVESYPLDFVDVLILNEIEGKDMTGKTNPLEIIDALSKRNSDLTIVLTLGAAGSILYTDKNIYRQNVDTYVSVVDTTAAGDTFIGYLVYGLANNMEPNQILKLASKASEICIGRLGAAVSIPKISEIL